MTATIEKMSIHDYTGNEQRIDFNVNQALFEEAELAVRFSMGLDVPNIQSINPVCLKFMHQTLVQKYNLDSKFIMIVDVTQFPFIKIGTRYNIPDVKDVDDKFDSDVATAFSEKTEDQILVIIVNLNLPFTGLILLNGTK